MKLRTRATERIKRRYLLIEGNDKEKAENALLEYIGLLGWAKAKPVFVLHEKLVLSLDRAWDHHARAAFTLAGLRVLKVSGTLKGLKA